MRDRENRTNVQKHRDLYVRTFERPVQKPEPPSGRCLGSGGYHNKLGLTNLLVGKPLVTLDQGGEVGVLEE